MAGKVRHNVNMNFDLIQSEHPETARPLKGLKLCAGQVVVPPGMGRLEGADKSFGQIRAREQQQDFPIDHPFGGLDIHTGANMSPTKGARQNALAILQPGTNMDSDLVEWSHRLLKGLSFLNVQKKF